MRYGFLRMLMVCLCIPSLGAQNQGWVHTDGAAGKHRGPVTALFQIENEIFSIGEDGFLVIWDLQKHRAGKRIQLSSYRIHAAVKHPQRDELCLVESDELGHYRISVWDYQAFKKIFSYSFNEPVAYVNYSAAGNFVIATLSGISGFVFLNSRNGALLRSPLALSASITFAATGSSERSMVSYFSSGSLCYWNLQNGQQIGQCAVPSRLSSPLIFGNNRYFTGMDSDGLALLDAVSGELLDQNRNISANSLLYVAADELYCLVSGKGIYHFSVEQNKLAEKKLYPIQTDAEVCAFAINEKTIAVGTADGNVIFYDINGREYAMTFREQVPLLSAAVSGSHIAFLSVEHEFGFIPLDYTAIGSGFSLRLEQCGAYTKISPLLIERGQDGQFLLWQHRNTRLFPCMVSANQNIPAIQLHEIPLRYPLRSAQAADGKLLLLDTAGNMSVVPFTGMPGRTFSFFAAGAMDAVFSGANHVLLCRSAISGNAPFLQINTTTGETVPLAWPADAGVMAYRSLSGAIYTAAVEEGENGIQTSIIRFNTANSAQSEIIHKYPDEDTHFSMAQAGSLLASTIGGEGAAVYTPGGAIEFERSPGLPIQLCGSGEYFITLDSDGTIAWYAAATGRLLALFKLYANRNGTQWELFTPQKIFRGQ